MSVELKSHQKEAVEKLGNGKILAGGVGTGKTLTALGYYVAKESPKDIYVFTTAKKRDSYDWESEAIKYGISTAREDSLHGEIKVDSWNNIAKYETVRDAFFIFDEQRLVGGGAWVKAFYKIARANRWIVLSATPGDVWVDYAPIFIANGFYRNITDFREQHVVYASFSKFPKIKHYIYEEVLQRNLDKILVDMPYERTTERIIHNRVVEHDRRRFERVLKERWNVYEDRPIKDVSELFKIMRMVVNSDESRVEEITRIFNEHKKLIIFYNFNYELDILRKLARVLWVDSAEWNGSRHEEIPSGDEWLYFVQYTAGAEGWNCIETDAMVFYSLNYSYRLFEQAQGRIDRLNTPFQKLHYYVLRSHSQIDLLIWKALKSKKNFNIRSLKLDVS